MLLCPLFSGSIEAVISKSSNQGFNSGKVTNIAIIWKKQGIVAKFPLIRREVKQISSLLFPVMISAGGVGWVKLNSFKFT